MGSRRCWYHCCNCFLLFGVGHYLYVKKMQENDIREFRSNLKEEFKNEIDARALSLQSYIDKAFDDKLKALSREIDIVRKRAEGDIDRLFAITAETNKLRATAAMRWLSCGVHLKDLQDDNLLTTALDAVQENIEALEYKDIDDLKRKLPRIEEYLNELAKTRKTEVDLIREILHSKLRLTPPVPPEENKKK